MDLLKLVTAGSVDDGKSTLIGRLLYDSKVLLADQLTTLEKSSRKKGLSYLDFSLITDGLKDEIAQGITIDVAYRYFTTGGRKYILADTPGHLEYTRNFVTGASNANLALLLIDAQKGVTEQTKRHALIASMMGIKHFVFCINKMDLVNYSRDVFEKIKSQIEDFSAKLEVYDVRYIPIAALNGENIVHKSNNMGWYTGWSVLETLENTHIASDKNLIDGRFPVQLSIISNSSERGVQRMFAGQVASGVFRINDEITILPSGINSVITGIFLADKKINSAQPPMSVSMTLVDDVDCGSGNIIIKKNNIPAISKELDIMLFWLDSLDIALNKKYIFKTVTQEVKIEIKDIVYVMNIHDYTRIIAPTSLKMNEIGRIRIRASTNILFDSYRKNRITGSAILIDEVSNATVAACIIL